MIECVFTLDYEIYGDGSGTLAELVYEPTKRLTEIFLRRGVRFVAFVEAAEFAKIEEYGTDPAIDLVRRQVRSLLTDDFEIGLHLHPQWCNARYCEGRWLLDYSEYNLCTLPPHRVAAIVERSFAYLRHLVVKSSFTPISFRAGNWLFQPTQPAASVLAKNGIRIDSSVFKGGLQRSRGLDYRPSLQNGHYWMFEADANVPDPCGSLLELPIWVEMVPFWKMVTTKRTTFHKNVGIAGPTNASRLARLSDFLRLRYPLKFDFCRMTLNELTWMMDRIIREDGQDPDTLWPVVAIGHSKDLFDLSTVEHFLAYLETKAIPVSTFNALYPRFRVDPTAS